MGKHKSLDLKQRVVAWHEEGRNAKEIAHLAGIGRSTVYDILNRQRRFGVPTNLHAQVRGSKRALTHDDLAFLNGLLAGNPTLMLDELQKQLLVVRGVDVHISTICRTLQRVGQSSKAVATEAAERNEALRAVWQADVSQYPRDYFIWLDESAADDQVSHRRKGRAPVGQSCIRRETWLRGVRWSILPALTVDGIIALDIFEGSVNKDIFMRFLRTSLAPNLQPFPGRNSIVVLDNCAIHHDEEIRQIIEVERGAKLIYLPPYSPDFNPIEQAFSCIKAWLRRHEARACAEARPWLIHQASFAITPEHAEKWIENAGY